MSNISREDIEHVALLARLEITPDQAVHYAEQLDRILDYAKKLDELDTEHVEPTSHCLDMTNVFRDDTPRPSLTPEQALANAPESEGQFFRVPKIIQEEN